MKRLAVIFIMFLAVISVSAQTDSSGFYVQSFRKLEWDLDARINHPVLDQNNRKAALIKVVIPEAGFDFDVGVMGVVGVKQEVGEVWVYVPEGVRKITIRHQNYGVIRGYEFSCPIESASVYEMRLHVPLRPKATVIVKVVIPEAGFDFDVGVMGVVGVKQEVGEVWVYVPEGVRKITIRHQNYGVIRGYEFSCPIESASVYEMRPHVPLRPKATVIVKDSVIVRDSIVYVPTPVYTKATPSGKRTGSGGRFNVRKQATQPKWSVLAVTNVPTPSFGLMTAWHARKVGAYSKVECLWGKRTDEGYTSRRFSVTVGGLFKCTDWLGICSGVGYGEVVVPPGSITYNGQTTDRYRVLNGFSLDLGAIARFGHITSYLGGNAIHDWKGYSYSIKRPKAFLEFGIGYSF